MGLFHNNADFLNAARKGDAKRLAGYVADTKRHWVERVLDANGDNALHLAVRSGSVAAVKALLADKIGDRDWVRRVNAHTGETAIEIAALAGRADIVKALAEDAVAARYLPSAVNAAIRGNHFGLFKEVIETFKIDLGSGLPAIYCAVAEDRPEFLKFLIERGADPSRPATHGFTEDDQRKLNRFHLDSGNAGDTPLFRAVRDGKNEFVRDLLRAGARFGENELPLHYAAAAGRADLAEALLAGHCGEPENGRGKPWLSAVNGWRQTALHLAVADNRPKAVQLLLAKGADASKKDSNQQTPLVIAQKFCFTEIIGLLKGPVPAAPEVTWPPPAAYVAPPPAAETKALPAVAVPSLPGRISEPIIIPAAAPVSQPSPAAGQDGWFREGADRVVYRHEYPAQNRRLTEIFNFETRERVMISENLALKSETLCPQGFDELSEQVLSRALDRFRQLGGSAAETAVFKSHLGKMKAGPAA